MSKTNKGSLAEGVPLAMIFKRELIASPEIVMLSQPRSVHAEKFRRLKTLLALRHGNELQVVVVTSAIPSEGKSTVALNLALAFAAEPESRTLVLDADLRRPTIGRMLKPAPQLGLSEILSGGTELAHAVLHLKNASLDVLPAGSRVEDPLELLTSQDAKNLFSCLRTQYDRIVVDTPPIIPFTDADALGALSDGVILVARAGVTPKSAYTQEITAVTSAKVLGTVLNGATTTLADAGSHYDSYYNSYYGRNHKR